MDIDLNLNTGTALVTCTKQFNKKLKFRVVFENKIYVYDIESNSPIIIPLQFGSGTYVFELYEEVIDKKYKIVESVKKDIKLENENACFLHPNCFVNYDASLEEFAREFKKETILKTVLAVREWIEHHVYYDYLRALGLKKNGELMPQIERVLKEGKGVYVDVAAFAVAVLRLNNIPARLVYGYANNHYHAWINYMREDGKWIRYDPTAAMLNIKDAKYRVKEFY